MPLSIGVDERVAMSSLPRNAARRARVARGGLDVRSGSEAASSDSGGVGSDWTWAASEAARAFWPRVEITRSTGAGAGRVRLRPSSMLGVPAAEERGGPGSGVIRFFAAALEARDDAAGTDGKPV